MPLRGGTLQDMYIYYMHMKVPMIDSEVALTRNITKAICLAYRNNEKEVFSCLGMH